MLPIILIIAAAGGLFTCYYTDNWLAQYTARVYLDLNLDLYVANSIAVIKSTSSTLLNQQVTKEFASAGELIGPELLESDLKEHWYLQAPPTATVAPVVVSLPPASLGIYYFSFALLVFLVIVAV